MVALPDSQIGDILLGAEQEIRLIDRLAPQNLPSERARLFRALSTGQSATPDLRYAPAPDLRSTRSRLSELAAALESGGPLAELYASRAEELEREAALVEAVSRPEFPTLSKLRFDPGVLSSLESTSALLLEWLKSTDDLPEREVVVSDDERHPHSLLNILRLRIGASRRPIRIEIRHGLPTIAAAGTDVVLIRPGVPLPPHRSERIALHELEAHVFPRCSARRETLSLFRTGARRSAEHEEGRALLLEERAGLMDGERRRELAFRHCAAVTVREGATLTETVCLLRGHGAELAPALDIALRAGRGGGLAREIVYLPAYMRIKTALYERPELERLFERGRVSLEAARLLTCPSRQSTPMLTGT